jgi:hypothetical protein
MPMVILLMATGGEVKELNLRDLPRCVERIILFVM